MTVQTPPLSGILLAPAINPDITRRDIYIRDPSDADSPFVLPHPPLTKIVAKKSKSFKYRKSFDAIFNDKPTTSALQKEIHEPSNFSSPPDLKTLLLMIL